MQLLQLPSVLHLEQVSPHETSQILEFSKQVPHSLSLQSIIKFIIIIILIMHIYYY